MSEAAIGNIFTDSFPAQRPYFWRCPAVGKVPVLPLKLRRIKAYKAKKRQHVESTLTADKKSYTTIFVDEVF